jgi:molybdate transport system ATP-binding protein
VTLEATIQKRLGEFTLDVGFAAPAGVTALFGPSGSGKTQTLRCIAGLARPDAGRISVGGRLLFESQRGIDVPVRDRRIGYVFQQYALFPHLDVAGNVAYGIHGEARDRRDSRVAELLDLVGLGGYQRRYPRELSGGQQQRVALARAMAVKPELLLLDEPFAALDAEIREQLRGDLDRLHRRLGLPVILVTHDRADVYALADRVIVYGGGRVLQVGTREEVFRRPSTAEVARLTGTPNLLPVRVLRACGDHIIVQCGDQELVVAAGTFVPGDHALAVIRPEVIQIVREDRAPSAAVGQNQLVGDIVERIPQGYTYRLRFQPRASLGVGGLVIVLPSLAYERLGLGIDKPRLVAIAPAEVHLIPREA